MDTINSGNSQYLPVGLQGFWTSSWRILFGRFSDFKGHPSSRVIVFFVYRSRLGVLSQSHVNLATCLSTVVLFPVLVSRYVYLCGYRATLIDDGASIRESFQRVVMHEGETDAHSKNPPPLLTTGIIRFILSAQFVAAGLVPRCYGGRRTW